MVVGAQPLSATKVGYPVLVQPRTDIDPSLAEQCDHQEGTVVTIGDEKVAF